MNIDYSKIKTFQEVELINNQKILENIRDLIREDFQKEADPLFFKYQRGEATKQEWLDKIQEIRDRYK
jgi:hypothetical protein